MTAQFVNGDLIVPAGTPIAAPVSLVIPMPDGWISLARLTIPLGHNGLTGWSLVLARTVIIPYWGSPWLVANDQHFDFPVDRWCNDGQLVVKGYNLGNFPHTFHLLLDWDPVGPDIPVSSSIDSGVTATPGVTAAVASLSGAAPDMGASLDVALVGA